MNLPPLPTTIYVLANPGGRWEQGYTLIDSAYTEEQMQAYGQACRAAALEEAAVGLETGDVSGLKDDAYMRSYTTHLLVSFAKYFRSLK